jgi:hypothetical protein
MNTNARFADYTPVIKELRLDAIRVPADIPKALSLGCEGSLTSYYIPFDRVNPDARIVLVGITPGFTQWKNAMREAQRLLLGGASSEDAHRAAKQTGAFSGAMRPNLIALLDHIGLQRWLGLSSCETLFTLDGHLVQTTSILRHPIFVDQSNYNGTPNMVRNPYLRRQIEEHFAPEAARLSDAVFVPLGPKVSEGLGWAVQRGFLGAGRILHGLPHPSGANAERIAYFLGRKKREALSAKTDAGKLDLVRTELIASVRALG